MKRHSLLYPVLLVALLASPFIWIATTVDDLSAAPGTGVLYGTDAANGNLITINTSTGAGTIVGTMSGGVVDPPGFPALAVSPITGVMYAGEGRGSTRMYTVDPNTGTVTLLGDSGLGFGAIESLEFSADGTLYASVNIAGGGGTGGDHLATINVSTGAATIIGPYGTCSGVTVPSTGGGTCTIQGMGGLAFDAFGNLWGAHNARSSDGPAGLYSINATTGAATFLYPVKAPSGAVLSGGLASIQFDCDGTLWGGSARAQGGAADGGRLIVIDPATGIAGFAGAVPATSTGTSLGALAFNAQCGPPPQQPRSSGYWKHQCGEMGYTQVSLAEMDGYFDQIDDQSSLFSECAEASCTTLFHWGSQKEMRPKAEKQALALWLNVVSGKLPMGTIIDLGSLSSAMTVGEALMEVQAVLCDPNATKEDLELAKNIAEALNLGGMDMEIATDKVAVKVVPGDTNSLKVAIINMSPYTWDYSLSVDAPWTIDLSDTTANNLRSGAMKIFTATLNAPVSAPKGDRVTVRFTATDSLSATTVTREIAVFGIVDGGGTNLADPKVLDNRSQ